MAGPGPFADGVTIEAYFHCNCGQHSVDHDENGWLNNSASKVVGSLEAIPAEVETLMKSFGKVETIDQFHICIRPAHSKCVDEEQS